MRIARSSFRLLAAALLMVAGLSPPPAFAQRIDDGLVAHYPFEGNLDEAAGIDTRPVVRGTLAYTSSGALGKALSVSGDDEIDFTGIPNSTFAGDFTLSWFMNLGSGDYYLFGKETTCDATSDFFTTGVNGSRLTAHFASASASGSVMATVARGRWVHVALVRGGTRAMLYIDGVPGTPQVLPATNLGAITAPLGLGTSPCIGRVLGGPTRPVGAIDEFRIYASALTTDKIEALARRPSFTATPKAATVGGKSIVRASHLVVDRTYEVRLVGSSTVTLFKGAATATSMNWTVTVPNVAPGNYKLYLVATLARGVENLERTVAFTVAPPLGIAASAPLQAGKKVTFTVANLLKSGGTSARLVYAGRVIAGPKLIDASSMAFTVVLPSDIPASLPASVTVRAEEIYGRIVTHVGSTTLPVAAPFTGKFATTQQVVSSALNVRPREPVSVTGKLALADGATVAGTGFTAYWVGDNGDVTPLSIKDLVIDSAGNFKLDTLPPSLGSMTAVRPKSSGKLRLVGNRVNSQGRQEWVVEDGPVLDVAYDVDPATDITVRVRRTTGEALAGAYVVLSSAAPLGYSFDPPNSGGGSGENVGGGSLYQLNQPGLGYGSVNAKTGKVITGGPALNQVNNGNVGDLPPPPAPACGEDLYRRYTDAEGRAEFPVLGGPEEDPDTFQEFSSMQFQADDCSSIGCNGATVSRTYTFELAVYTLHRGAGFRDTLSGAEIPTRFRIEYNRDSEVFSIKNLRTGVTTTQNVSANLLVEVPQIATSSFIPISPALMYHEIGGQPVNLVGKITGGGFGKWVDFTGTRVGGFVNASPDKVIQFGHRPDANGSLVSAKLFLTNLVTGQPSFIGDFQQVNLVDGCNLQDNPGANVTETWRLKIGSAFANSWRFPQGVFFNAGAERKACGFIEAKNAQGGTGKRNVCFHWQEAPGFMYEDGGPIVVDDTDMQDVKIERTGSSLGAGSTSANAPASFLGEQLDQPGRVDNQTNARSSAYSSIGAGGERGGARRIAGNNPKQFSAGAGGDDEASNFAQGTTVIDIGEDEYQTILDTTIPLFQWYWGVPEILSAEVYARLRLFAQYYFHGTLRKTGEGENLDMLTNAVFGAAIMVGVDIDVLFGFIVDAGASLTGLVLSEMTIKIEDNVSSGLQACLSFQLMFSGYVDPCPVCPTPVIEFGGNPDGIILDKRVPDNCVLYSQTQNKAAHPDLASLATVKAQQIEFGFAEARAMRRQPALAFDGDGNGQYIARDASNGLVAQAFDGSSLSPGALLSTAMGVRDPQIAYFDADRAIAVWSESALSQGTYVASSYLSIARNQRIAWAEWDGESWGDKQFLTAAGPGEGQIGLTACADGDAGCPAGGEVLAVWQRDANANVKAPQYRLWFAQFRPATGFTAAASMDATPTAGVQDITPSATYLNGKPVVVWVRQFGGSLDDFGQRNLAYRVLPSGTTAVVAAAPGALAPSVVAGSTSSIRVAWLKSDPSTSTNPDVAGKGAVGTQNALYVAQATCSAIASTCTFPTSLVPATRDVHGRRIYGGERPRLVRGERDVFVIMRAFRFESPNGESVQSGDPLGTVLTTGDLVMVAPNYSTGIARVTPLSADGFMHMGPVAAYNPVSNTIVSGSSVFAPPFVGPFRAALKASGFKGHLAYSKTVASNGPVELGSLTEAPDLAVESVQPLGTLAPNSAQTARVLIGNRGATYSAALDGLVKVKLHWDSPGGPVVGSADLGTTSAGGERSLDIAWTAPAGAFADEAHALYVVLDTPDGFDEITDDNNQLALEYAGLPVPQSLASDTLPGIPQVQLGWDDVADARVAGYRVYVRRTDGSWDPLGASPVQGFLDLSSSFNVARTYAVASYSARGIESAKSEPVTVMTMPLGAEPDFRDGFEDPLP
jgi:hypothetical protein